MAYPKPSIKWKAQLVSKRRHSRRSPGRSPWSPHTALHTTWRAQPPRTAPWTHRIPPPSRTHRLVAMYCNQILLLFSLFQTIPELDHEAFIIASPLPATPSMRLSFPKAYSNSVPNFMIQQTYQKDFLSHVQYSLGTLAVRPELPRGGEQRPRRHGGEGEERVLLLLRRRHRREVGAHLLHVNIQR